MYWRVVAGEVVFRDAICAAVSAGGRGVRDWARCAGTVFGVMLRLRGCLGCRAALGSAKRDLRM